MAAEIGSRSPRRMRTWGHGVRVRVRVRVRARARVRVRVRVGGRNRARATHQRAARARVRVRIRVRVRVRDRNRVGAHQRAARRVQHARRGPVSGPVCSGPRRAALDACALGRHLVRVRARVTVR